MGSVNISALLLFYNFFSPSLTYCTAPFTVEKMKLKNGGELQQSRILDFHIAGNY